MRLVFAGTPEFAAVALAALIHAGHDIALVLTQPDRPAGRGMKLLASPVKQLATRHGLPVEQPLSLKRDAEARARLAAANADAMIVAAYGLILPQEVLDMPRLGCLNIHASLLPRWRGAAPIQRAIEAGDRETGISIMQMEAGLDTGPVLAGKATPIGDEDTAASLHDRLADMGAQLICETLPRLRLPLQAVPQSREGIVYAAKIGKEEAALDWNKSAQELDRRIRAFNPFPVARTIFQDESLKIWAARPLPAGTAHDSRAASPGSILAASQEGIAVACGQGVLLITELQKPGGKRLSAARFLPGCPALATRNARLT
ncbi:MAG: methionyl-tRNA formyltransferase [Zoogloeaceae bacterium]|jgi:methionyl-tRNA formyltransferase|nr:methionyl-tRNA formyltransferase [Zoogloeaceae bacterium]